MLGPGDPDGLLAVIALPFRCFGTFEGTFPVRNALCNGNFHCRCSTVRLCWRSEECCHTGDMTARHGS